VLRLGPDIQASSCECRRVTNLHTLRALAFCGALVACSNEGDSYVFLADLCSSYAEDVCSARTRCCDAEDGCIRDVTDACEAARDELVLRKELSYNASRASAARTRSVDRLVSCDAPLPVSAFFDGTLSLDAECTDDLACASGRCQIDADADTGLCVASDESLCVAP
jgi:hypothetical protein